MLEKEERILAAHSRKLDVFLWVLNTRKCNYSYRLCTLQYQALSLVHVILLQTLPLMDFLTLDIRQFHAFKATDSVQMLQLTHTKVFAAMVKQPEERIALEHVHGFHLIHVTLVCGASQNCIAMLKSTGRSNFPGLSLFIASPLCLQVTLTRTN